VAAAYFPAAQLEQADEAAAEYLPTTHVLETAAKPSAAQVVPAWQLVHKEAPVLGW